MSTTVPFVRLTGPKEGEACQELYLLPIKSNLGARANAPRMVTFNGEEHRCAARGMGES
jgi:hypothetical protein